MPERTDQPAAQPTPQACTGCSGSGGRIVDTSSDGITRQNWITCQACGGTGKQNS